MSKNQIGEQVQVFCKRNYALSLVASFISGKNWTENVKIQWEYKTPTLKIQPNVTRLQISSIDSNYFNFDLYYRNFSESLAFNLPFGTLYHFQKIIIRPMFTVVDDASSLIVPSSTFSETSSSKRHQAAFRPNPTIQEVSINQLEAVHSVINPIKTRINEKMSPKKEYRFRSRLKFHWERTGYLPCSATCESGHQESVIGCFNKYGIQVHDNHCDSKRRPPIVRRQCASLTCLPRWEASEWSQCSTSCGPGKIFICP